MSVLCAGSCHVYLVGSLRCTCGQRTNGYPPPPAVATTMMYYPANYNPYGPRAPKPDPPADVSLVQLRAAQHAGASHLSADGLRAYCERYGAILQAEWDGANFGVWWPVAELPADVVKI